MYLKWYSRATNFLEFNAETRAAEARKIRRWKVGHHSPPSQIGILCGLRKTATKAGYRELSMDESKGAQP
jgi:hypothetical protein